MNRRWMRWCLMQLAWVTMGFVLVLSLGYSHSIQAQTTATVQAGQPRPAVDAVVQATLRQLQQTRARQQARVTRTAIVGNYALANWMRGQVGGQALLLRSTNQQWSIVQLGGGSMNRAALIGLGVPPSTADQLLRR